MTQTTDIGTATTMGAEKAEGHGLRRCLGRYARFFLVPLVALALFGAVSVAAPKEALAAGSGWYWTNHGGQNYECYWVYYGNDVWSEDGCKFYYGGSLPAYYNKFSTGQTLVDINGTWHDTAYYWNNSSLSNYITVGGYNSSGVDLFMAQVNASLNDVWLRSDAASARLSSYSSEPGPKAPTVSGAPEQGSEAPGPNPEASRSPETSRTATSKSAFPWKVCQDDSKCMRYGKDAWKKVRTGKAQGGTYRVSSSKTRGAFFAASGATDAGGRTMKLLTNTGPKMGKAKVLVVNLANAKVVKQVAFDLRTSKQRFKVEKSITGLTPHKPYGLVVLSANGKPVAVDAVGYEAHGNMCHNVL